MLGSRIPWPVRATERTNLLTSRADLPESGLDQLRNVARVHNPHNLRKQGTGDR